jgi:hypothetical protein
MLFSKGGCTQGFNTFLTALKLPRRKAGSWILNPFGTNKTSKRFAAPRVVPRINLRLLSQKLKFWESLKYKHFNMNIYIFSIHMEHFL